MKKHIPNSLTLANLFCGAVGIIFVFQSKMDWAIGAMLIGAIFDFFDGFVARALNVSGKLGAELDSMADMVTFGTLPGIMMYNMLLAINPSCEYIPYFGLLIAVFSGLRLAMFNISTEQSENFIGLPTPINAVFIASLYFVEREFLQNEYVLIVITLFSSLMLVSKQKIIALKFKGLGFKENIEKWVVIGNSIILLFIFQIQAIPLILLLYILTSILHFNFNIFKK